MGTLIEIEGAYTSSLALITLQSGSSSSPMKTKFGTEVGMALFKLMT